MTRTRTVAAYPAGCMARATIGWPLTIDVFARYRDPAELERVARTNEVEAFATVQAFYPLLKVRRPLTRVFDKAAPRLTSQGSVCKQTAWCHTQPALVLQRCQHLPSRSALLVCCFFLADVSGWPNDMVMACR